MTMKTLAIGSSLSGLLVDGVAGTPYVGATLKVTDDLGVIVEVPYLPFPAATQFGHVREWFDDQSPPANMVLLTPEGTISLFEVAWSGHSEMWGGRRASVGTLRPALTVLSGRDGELAAPLVIANLHSRLDGLNEWSRLSAVTSDFHADEAALVQAVTLDVRHQDGPTWTQGDATLTIRAGWYYSTHSDAYDRTVTIDDNVHIETIFSDGPRPFWDHFVEQRKVANLMVLLFGRGLAFREHKLRDQLFVSRTDAGRIQGRPWIEVISRNTFRERRAEIPADKALKRPIARMEQIGAKGLETWAANYETWQRFILPAVAVLGRDGRFIEDVVISNAMSLEAAGGILGERAGERATWTRTRAPRPTTATYVYRCLDVLDVKWPDGINDKVGLARAIARNYNDVKHYDRGDFPDHKETRIVSEVAEMIARLLAVYVAGRGEEVLPYYRDRSRFFEIEQLLEAYELTLDGSGDWIRGSEATAASVHDAR